MSRGYQYTDKDYIKRVNNPLYLLKCSASFSLYNLITEEFYSRRYVMKYDINAIEILDEKLEILKKNDENVSAEDLRTKYAKAYNRLKNEISEAIYNAVHVLNVMSWDFFEKDEKEAVDILREAYKTINERCFNPENKEKLEKLAFCSYSSDLIYRQAELMIGNLEVDVYFPYWEKYCVHAEPGFHWNLDKEDTQYDIYNPLCDAYWKESYHLWVNNNEDGTPYWRGGGLSPFREYNIQYQADRNKYDKEKIDEFWRDYYQKAGKILTFDDELPDSQISYSEQLQRQQ